MKDLNVLYRKRKAKAKAKKEQSVQAYDML